MTTALPYIKLRRKIKFETEPTEWHHQRGGWSYVIQQLRSKLYAPDGILCISALEDVIVEGVVINEPWIGFVHQVPKSNYKYFPDLERMVVNEVFIKSLEKCLGLFVISSRVKDYLVKHDVSVPVVRVFYPITPFPGDLKFSIEKFERESKKTVLFVGEFMRNYQAFYDLKVPEGYKKILLKSPDVDFDNLYDTNHENIVLRTNDSVSIVNRVSDEDYDQLLSCSIVFLNMYDAGANTTVIECLGRYTPIIINRLPGVEEYLGKEYPLYYDTLNEANELVGDVAKVVQATRYLAEHDAINPLTGERFVHEFASSAIYRSLPLPNSQKSNSEQTKFPSFDVTVVICSYKRVYNMKNLLQCFANQDFHGQFEVIIWNNNKETQSEIAEICSPFEKDLHIRLIQSSENYYCIIRLAISQLMQSKLLLVCDDDVIPKTNFISRFVEKFEEYGPNAVIGCRGHIFKQHTLCAENPHLFWEDYCDMKFFDQTKSDRQVRFTFTQHSQCV